MTANTRGGELWMPSRRSGTAASMKSSAPMAPNLVSIWMIMVPLPSNVQWFLPGVASASMLRTQRRSRCPSLKHENTTHRVALLSYSFRPGKPFTCRLIDKLRSTIRTEPPASRTSWRAAESRRLTLPRISRPTPEMSWSPTAPSMPRPRTAAPIGPANRQYSHGLARARPAAVSSA